MLENESIVETVDESVEVPFRIDDLHATGTMLRAYIDDVFPPPNEKGQVHFGYAMMKSAIEAIEFAEKWVEQQRSVMAGIDGGCEMLMEAIHTGQLANAKSLTREIQRRAEAVATRRL